MDKISVIMPCYNAEKTLVRALNSIREQTYKNIEIIIVDDGSSDDTLKLAYKYASIDERIKVIEQANAGVSVARNNGLLHATGEYIAFIDADDNYTTPYAYAKMMQKLKQTDADMCVCNFVHPCFEQHLQAGVYDLSRENDLLNFYEDFFVCSMPWNKIRKRDTITQQFAVGVRVCEDELFNVSNLQNVKKVVVLDEVLYNYYCAPYIPKDSASAITTAFRDCKSTVWHTFVGVQPLIEKALDTFMPNMANELKYVHAFTLLFCSVVLLAKNQVPEDVLVDTCQAIFKEDLFVSSIKQKERYGLKLKPYTKKDIENFALQAYKAYNDIKRYNLKLSMYKVLLTLFNGYFYLPNGVLKTNDIVARCYKEYLMQSSAEAIYVMSRNEQGKMEKQQDCKFVVLDSNLLCVQCDSEDE